MLRMRWGGLLASHVILFLLLTGPSLQCGRGGWRRRGSRKMTPLVFKQHIPNVSENTLGGSGMAEGVIKRDSPKFEELKVNYNTDIIFKDEEGTMADRVMTQRCKDKLNTLAISVMNQWPGVKLRVTEGWDEDGSHSKDSLHYEGRAVDITTSDRERSKYGMLARLAVEAGFDWVYYESRGHIHCSVKSDTSIASNYGGCFSGMDTVMTESGDQVSLSSLRIGDRVLSFRPDGQLTYSPVLLFFHQSPDAGTHFLDLHTSDGILLSITANHLLYYSTVNDLHISEVTPRFASNLREGNFVYLIDKDGHIVTRQVTQIVKRQQTGLYAPLTEEGTIVVNGVLASCYAHIEHHGIAHTALSPVRWLHQLGRLLGPYLTWPSERASPTRPQGGASPTPPTARANHTSAETQPKDTVHWYAALLHSLADYVIPKHLLYPTT